MFAVEAAVGGVASRVPVWPGEGGGEVSVPNGMVGCVVDSSSAVSRARAGEIKVRSRSSVRSAAERPAVESVEVYG